MIYSNIGIYKYGKTCEISPYQMSRIERPKIISNIRGIRKDAIQLYDFLKTPDILYSLIELFHQTYCIGEIGEELFSKEFYNVVGLLTQGIIPLELDFISVDEILDYIEEILRGEL